MKKIITCSFLLLLTAIGFLSCEKDDLCAEGSITTPNLVVEFYDKDNRTVLKNVTYFQYFTTDGDTLPSYKTYLNTNKILVPLRTDNEESQWIFSLGKKVNSDTIYNNDALLLNMYITKFMFPEPAVLNLILYLTRIHRMILTHR